MKLQIFLICEIYQKKDIEHITTDFRIFFQVKEFFTYDDHVKNELIIESDNKLNVSSVINELSKIGFLPWQIKSEILHNSNKIIILYADIKMNTDILKDKIESMGLDFASISKLMMIYSTICRAMVFDPAFPQEITQEISAYAYLYHWTPEERVESILRTGLEPRSENQILLYKPKVHLIKETATEKEISILRGQLYSINTTVKKQ